MGLIFISAEKVNLGPTVGRVHMRHLEYRACKYPSLTMVLGFGTRYKLVQILGVTPTWIRAHDT